MKQLDTVSAPSHSLSPQQACRRGSTRQNRLLLLSMQRLSLMSVPQPMGPVAWPSSKPQQNCLDAEPVCLPAQSAGQVRQFSPSPPSHRPLPHSAPLTLSQSFGQLSQSSAGSHIPSLLQ